MPVAAFLLQFQVCQALQVDSLLLEVKVSSREDRWSNLYREKLKGTDAAGLSNAEIMEDPIAEIPRVIQSLCQDPPSLQRETIETYFTPTASFTHPFCRTGTFNGSRSFVLQIYRWYKILSPHIDVNVESVAFDEKQMLLYVSIYQLFRIRLVPFYRAPVSLTTVLQLTIDPDHLIGLEDDHEEVQAERSKPKKYYIQSQNDLYQTSEFVKFVIPFGIGVTFVTAWQYIATFLCILGALTFWPITKQQERRSIENGKRVADDSGN